MIKLLKTKLNSRKFFFMTATLKTVSKDSSRYSICNVHIEQDDTHNTIIGTNGKCLSVLSIPKEYPAGDYEIIKSTSTEIILMPLDAGKTGIYPSWEKVIPEYSEYSDFFKMDSMCFSSFVFSVFKQGIKVNIDYLKNIFCKNYEYSLGHYDDKKAIVIKYETATLKFRSVIMPMNNTPNNPRI